MEFKKIEQSTHNTRNTYCMYFNTRHAGNTITFQPPVSNHKNTWVLIPTLICHRDPSIIPGPSFTLKFKWLKWDILTLKWSRSWKDTEIAQEDSLTARIRTSLYEDFQVPASRFPSQTG